MSDVPSCNEKELNPSECAVEIRRLRLEKGHSLRAFCDITGIDTRAWSRFERGIGPIPDLDVKQVGWITSNLAYGYPDRAVLRNMLQDEHDKQKEARGESINDAMERVKKEARKPATCMQCFRTSQHTFLGCYHSILSVHAIRRCVFCGHEEHVSEQLKRGKR